MPQRSLDERDVFLSEKLTNDVTNQTLISSQQMIPLQIMSLIKLENLYNRAVRLKVKEIICNLIYLKIVVPKLTYHMWNNFVGCSD